MAIGTEKEQVLLLLDQVHEKSDEVSRHETALRKLQDHLDQERAYFGFIAKENAEAASEQLLSEIGEADREEQAKQQLRETRQKRAAKLMAVPMLLFLFYICLSVFAFFRLAQAATFTDVFNPRFLFANEGVISVKFIVTMILCLLLYAYGVGIWHRRKKQYVRHFDPDDRSGSRSKFTVVFVMLFIPILMLPLWVGYLTFALYQTSKWQAIVHPLGTLAFVLILAAYCLFSAKPNKKESAYLRGAVLQDKEIRAKRERARQAAKQTVAEAVEQAVCAFDSSTRAKELRQEILRAQADLDRSKKELDALPLQEEYKSSGTAAAMADCVRQGRAETLEEAFALLTQKRAVKNFQKIS